MFMMLYYLSILGFGVAAVTGAIAAGRKKMDFFGVIVVAGITALGGGTVRDTIFNTYPITWISHPGYLAYTSVCALITIFVSHYLIRLMKWFLILDALGLSAFVITGTQKILNAGFSPSVAVIGGMLTGICGGMLRDILCNDIPLVLREELYAIIALGGSLLLITLSYFHFPDTWNVCITFFAMFITRVCAILFHIEMPKFDYTKNIRKRYRKP